MPPEIAKKIERFFIKYPVQHYRKGHVLIQAGDNPRDVYYLTKGSVRQYDITNNGDEVVVNIFKPIAFFPMSYAINRKENEYFFEVAEDITVRQAPLDAAVTFVEENPDVLFNLLSRVYSGTDGLLRRLAHLMGGSARSRLIFELIITCRRFGETSHGDEYFITLKEAELAARVGLTRETVNRQLHELKGQGLIHKKQSGFVIKDLAKLEHELGNSL